jgi:hypothetical protein
MSSSSQALHLYRRLIRTGHQYNNYYFSNYVIRRTREEFQRNRTADATRVPDLLAQGAASLAIARRQATISKLYPRETLVIEQV